MRDFISSLDFTSKISEFYNGIKEILKELPDEIPSFPDLKKYYDYTNFIYI